MRGLRGTFSLRRGRGFQQASGSTCEPERAEGENGRGPATLGTLDAPIGNSPICPRLIVDGYLPIPVDQWQTDGQHHAVGLELLVEIIGSAVLVLVLQLRLLAPREDMG